MRPPDRPRRQKPPDRSPPRVEKTPPMAFPKVPIRQTIVRQMVRNRMKGIPSPLRENAKECFPFAMPGYCAALKRYLPSIILLKTNKSIGVPICEGYRILYSAGLAGRPRWVRELFFSPSSTPHSCLRKLSSFLESSHISRQKTSSIRV